MTRPGDEHLPEHPAGHGHGEQLPEQISEQLPERIPDDVSDDDLFDTFRLPGEPPRPADAQDAAASTAGTSAAADTSADATAADTSAAAEASADAGTSAAADAATAGVPPVAAAHGAADGAGRGRRREEQLYAPGEEPREVDPDDAGFSLLGRDAADDGADAPEDPAAEDPVAEERRRRRRFRQIRGIVIIGVLVLVLGSVLSRVIGGLLPGDAADYPRTGGDQVSFTVNDGEGAIVISRRLEEEGIVASAKAFQQEAEMSPGKHIQSGEYELQEQMTAADAVKALQGAGRAAVSYVVVDRGQRLPEVLDRLAAATPHDRSAFVEAVQDPTAYGLPEQATTVEGYLASGEYRLPVKDSPEQIIQALVAPTFAELEKMGITDPEEQFRTVTIASIVEAEALPQDYPMVAGIIENRLRPDNAETHGLLQIDATVIYGLGERRLQFSSAERRDASNEYNTYVHKGLTPGPIGAPSLKAIDAAAKPEDSDYYYWVTVDISTGETKFAKTYAEHQKYQNEYRAYCRENPDIC